MVSGIHRNKRDDAPAYAQSSSQTFKLNIPQQALRKSIVYFGKETGFDVIADGAVTERVTAHPVSGTMTAQQALATMLKGSGVQYRFTDEHTVILETSEAWNARAQALTLDTVEVNSNQRQENGYVATRGMTATKTSTPLIETPQSVSVVTQEQIAIPAHRWRGFVLYRWRADAAVWLDARYDQF